MTDDKDTGLIGILRALDTILLEPDSADRTMKIHGQYNMILDYFRVIASDAQSWSTQYTALLVNFEGAAKLLPGQKGHLTLGINGRHEMFGIEYLGPFVNDDGENYE